MAEPRGDAYQKSPQSDGAKREQGVSRAILAALIAAFGPVSFGYCIGYSSSALEDLQNADYSSVVRLSADQGSWFSSLITVGAIFGSPLAGWAIDKLGRKSTIMLCVVPFVLGWLLIGFAQNLAMLYSGRVISGLACGAISVAAPVYISETAPPRLRGTLGTFNQMGIVSGILFSFITGHALNWYWCAIIGTGFPICLLILMIFMPETVCWLLARGKEKRAYMTAWWLRGPNADVEKEIMEIKDSLENKERMSIKEFAKPSLLRPFAISLALHFFQQSTGINAVMFYCATIFQKAGFQNKSTMVPILIGIIQVVAAALSVIMISHAGRRFLLIVGGVGMSISLFSLGSYFYISENSLSKNSIVTYYDFSWVAVTSVAVYIVAFGMTWGPCAWLIMSEIFPVKARGIASGNATLFNWTCAFTITKTFPFFINTLTAAGTFWLYGSQAIMAVFFVYVCVPETEGKSLEKIQMYFEGKGKKERDSIELPIRETYV